MSSIDPISRRRFLRTSLRLAAGCAAAAGGICACKPIHPSDAKTYYRDQKDDLMKENRQTFQPMLALLAEKYSEKEAQAIQDAVFARFEILLPDLPYIGGSANELTSNLVSSAAGLAFYLEMKSRGVAIDETGRLLYQTVQNGFAGNPMNGMMGRLSNSDLMQSKLQQAAEVSHKRTYPEDWVFDFIPGDGTFDFGVDYTECGICKYFQAQGAAEFTPYMCLLDGPVSQAMNTGLVRTQTLARGGQRCDFRYLFGRTVQLEWDPGYLKGDTTHDRP